LMAGRLSDPDTMCGQNKCSEAYMLYLNGKYYYRETQDKESVLAISRNRFGFNVQAGPLVKPKLFQKIVQNQS